MPAETHVEGNPIGRDEVLALVRDRLADILEIEPSEIGEGDSFADDLNADSLDLVELIMSLEEEFGVTVEEEELEGITTIGGAYDLIVDKL